MEALKIKLLNKAISKHGYNNIEPCLGKEGFAECYTEITRRNKETDEHEQHLMLWYNLNSTNSTHAVSEIIQKVDRC